MQDRLSDISGIRLYGKNSGSILLFSASGFASEEIASYLDEYGICVRAGLHCSPLAHKKLGTPKNDGAVRVSLGAFNSEREANELCYRMERLMTGRR